MNNKLYEINIRPFLTKQKTDLSGIDFSYFQSLKNKGIDYVWLMGIWQNSKSSVEKHCFNNDLIHSYSKSLKDWKKEDVAGSPFAIEDYCVNDLIGTENDLLNLKEKLNSIGMKLFLDFIPNHFNCDTALKNSIPQLFLHADEEIFSRDSFTFFRDKERIFAHGRDPLFPAWTDTIQVNLFNRDAREFLIQSLLKIANLCDGIRCDMAMLALNNVFSNTWLGVLSKQNISKPENEFWYEAIKAVKEKFPGFIFLAETYWDLEWELQQLGFDYTYDKRLFDRLTSGDVEGIKAHLTADHSFQSKLVRFIENHDELRSIVSLGKSKSLAAATVMFTTPGLKLIYDGQFEGKRVKLPVQLNREPDEAISSHVKKYYDKLLEITNNKIFFEGDWLLLETDQVGENFSCENILAWQWSLKNEFRLIVINYSDSPSQCCLRFNLSTNKETITLTDILNNESYTRVAADINSSGLYIDLKGYQSHIFSYSI